MAKSPPPLNSASTNLSDDENSLQSFKAGKPVNNLEENSNKSQPFSRVLPLNFSPQEWETRNYNRRRAVMLTIMFILTCGVSLSFVISFLTDPNPNLPANNNIFSAFRIFNGISAILFLVTAILIRFKTLKNNAKQGKKWLNIAAYLALFNLTFTLAIILNSDPPNPSIVTAAFMLTPILTMLFEVSWRGAWVTIIVGGVVLGATILFGDISRPLSVLPTSPTLTSTTTINNPTLGTNANSVTPSSAAGSGSASTFTSNLAALGTDKSKLTILLGWLMMYTLVSSTIMVFASRQQSFLTLIEQQALQVGGLNQTLQSTNELGGRLSQTIAGATAELGSASRQHALSSQEQVAGINQTTISLTELGETAGQIATSATSASLLADKTVLISTSINRDTQLAQATAEEGNRAVEDTIRSVERVRDRIELLGQRLLMLTEQNRRVGAIIDLIDEIADETHLLALNASIEAAGNIQWTALPTTNNSNKNSEMQGASNNSNSDANTLTITRRGERFGVIAGEIRNLADRSRESTEEVRQAISEMQGSVASAVLVAEESKKETAVALLRSKIAGAVISKLMAVIQESINRVQEILGEAEQVKTLCSEISLATNQQRSANQQILQSMQTISHLSEENAGIMLQIVDTVFNLNAQMEELNQLLVNQA